MKVRVSDFNSWSVGLCGLPQGEKLDDGCSAEDYRIKVGFGNCTVVDFASNQLSCEPPTVKPEVDVEDIVHCGNSTSTLAVVVSAFIIIIIKSQQL